MRYYYIIILLISFIGTNAQVINFTDPELKALLLSSDPSNFIAMDTNGNYIAIDTDDNNEIDETEAAQVSELRLNNNDYLITDISSLASFPNLKYLGVTDCSINNPDISAFTQLETLACAFGDWDTVNLTNANLKKLIYQDSSTTSISIAGLPALEELDIAVSYMMQSLDLTGAASLKILNVNECAAIQNIDASPATNLEAIYAQWCTALTSVNIKNGSDETVNFQECTNLQFICTDDNQIAQIQNMVPATCEVNSYCSFEPGGSYFTINGNSTFDADYNGCGGSDVAVPNVKFQVTDGVTNGTFIADELGSYSLPLPAGQYLIEPVIEDGYFVASPALFGINFPADGNVVTQDICIVPNGTHNNLEVIIMPIDAARPGFDASYQLLFRNVGNTTLQTNMNLQFDDNVMDFVQSVPMPSSQSVGTLDWMNLSIAPFETRTLLLTMNMNSPTDTPALNNGDQIDFTASLSYNGMDETPSNNIDEFTQTLVNSFDPNDKTCLEGDTITPTMVGDYVHYLIRFENTGTFPAENIVVKDMIDTAKFDISSLVPINSNFEFTTRITDTNKVEFIFENINLPFDDANNDGYILFKIKTKPTLTLGNTISNIASIYFDYNFPIVTNPAVTTVAIPLSTDDNENTFGFTLYPNPTKNTLNISSKTNAIINEILIYNTLGQQVMKVLPALGDYSIDVSRLAVGSYVVKVASRSANWTTQFIKE